MPVKLEYMNRVLGSCINLEQAKGVLDWTKKVINNYEVLAGIKAEKYVGIRHSSLWFLIDFIHEFRKFREKINFYYGEKCKALSEQRNLRDVCTHD